MVQMTVSFFPPFSPFFINQVVILSRTTYTYLIFYQPIITREIKINTKKIFLIAQNQPVCHTVITTSVSTSILTNYVTLFHLIETYRYANQSLDFYLDFTLYPYKTHSTK